MRLDPQSFNEFLFQNETEVISQFINSFDWEIQGIGTENIARSQNFPAFASKNYAPSLKVINVVLNNVNSDRDPMIKAMDILGEDQIPLFALDELGRLWYVMAVCIGVNLESTSDNTASFGVTFDVADPIWKLYEPSEGEILVTAGTGNDTFTPFGNQPALPIIEITPTSAGEFGFAFRRFVQVINNSPNALNAYPLNVVGTVLDTASLVNDTSKSNQLNGGINAIVTTIDIDVPVGGGLPPTGMGYIGTEQISWTANSGTQLTGVTRGIGGTTAAVHADNAVISRSKVLANGEDLRVYVNGAEVKRWLQDMNSANTKIWINWTQPANSNMTLGEAIASSGDVDIITFENTAGNIALMSVIPPSGNVLIGTEIFTYTGKNVLNRLLTGVTRAERQTSMGAHIFGATVKFVNNDLWIYYGAPGIDPYVVDDTNKPLIELTSTNTSWIQSFFGNDLGGRNLPWIPALGAGNPGIETYTGEAHTNEDPYESTGIYVNSVLSAPATAEWRLYHPIGITTVTVTGQKARTGAAVQWGSWLFQKSNDATLPQPTWTTVWTEAAPVGALFWEALSSHSGVSLSGTYNYIRMALGGVSPGVQPQGMEFDDVTLTLDSALAPTVNVSADDDVFTLHSVFTNAANGFQMIIDLVMTIGDTLTINTKEKTITLQDGSNQINALQEMPVRVDWFPFLPAEANLITITEDADTTNHFIWEDRAL